jgi:hypothetical protein
MSPATADLGTNPAYSAAASAVPAQTAQASEFGNINSPAQQQMDARVEAALAGMSPYSSVNNSFSALANAGPMAAPVSATPTGILGTTPGLMANATATPVQADQTGVLSGYQPTQAQTPSESALSGILGQSPSLLSSTSLASQTPSLSAISPSAAMFSPSITQAQSFTPSVPASSSVPMSNVQFAGDMSMLNSGYHLPTANVPSMATDGLFSAPPSVQSIVDPTTVPGSSIPSLNAPSLPSSVLSTPTNIAQDPALSMPSLDTISVPDQPTVAAPTDTSNVTVQGPATTAAATQQQPSLPGSFPAAPAKAGLLSGALNKGTLAGGLLGGVVAGPVGGILGGLLGNALNKSGGLTGLLGGTAPTQNQIAGGMQNLGGIWGGSFPAGTTATANNGDQVESMGNGWTSVTNQFGVTTSFGPNNITASYFGPSLNGTSATQGQPGGGGGTGGGLF